MLSGPGVRTAERRGERLQPGADHVPRPGGTSAGDQRSPAGDPARHGVEGTTRRGGRPVRGGGVGRQGATGGDRGQGEYWGEGVDR